MNEMIERVARALCRARGGDPDYVVPATRDVDLRKGVDCIVPSWPYWKRYEVDARAVLEAMREPTEAMIDAADKEVPADSDNLQCPAWFTAAIDAALSPAPQER